LVDGEFGEGERLVGGVLEVEVGGVRGGAIPGGVGREGAEGGGGEESGEDEGDFFHGLVKRTLNVQG
jgi:hypothetical protein